ncbi:MAG: hypothetical protein ACE5KI_06045 [Dehalococcoidia bacterium]
MEGCGIRWVVGAPRIRLLFLFGVFVILFIALACSGSDSTAAPTAYTQSATVSEQGVEKTSIETTSYRVEIWIGPALSMMTAFPVMSTTDQGQPVNRHIEIHIFDKSGGAEVTDVIPLVRITNETSAVSRELAEGQEAGASQGASFVTACLISGHRDVQVHFGDNISLPDGKYTFTIVVGDETAVLKDIIV